MSSPYVFSMESPGHWHVYWTKRLRFSVHHESSHQPASGLRATLLATRAGDDRVTEMPAVEAEPGVYGAEFTVWALAPHAFSLRIEDGGAVSHSQPWAVEIARDGDEGVRIDAQGSSYVYQVRYDWSPGPLVADDERPVLLTFEIMRGIPTGDAIQWERPWLNAFDHVNDAREAEVIVESVANGGAPVREVLAASYRGMGVYQARRVFLVAEAASGRDYAVTMSFRDPHNGARVRNPQPYKLVIAPRASADATGGAPTSPAHGSGPSH